jgi:hypothetical protein
MSLLYKSFLNLAFALCLLLVNSRSIAQQVIVDTTLNQKIESPVIAGDTGTINTTPKDSVIVATDSVRGKLKKMPFEPNPKKAGLYSAILPGLGQIYDRKYWKLPIIYAAAGTAAYFISLNSQNYRKYRKAYVSRQDANPNNDELKDLYNNPDDLKQLQDEYKKYLDLTVLISAVAYTAQVIDAIVYAHLKNFDISRDISMHFGPVAQNNYAGLGLIFTLK